MLFFCDFSGILFLILTFLSSNRLFYVLTFSYSHVYISFFYQPQCKHKSRKKWLSLVCLRAAPCWSQNQSTSRTDADSKRDFRVSNHEKPPADRTCCEDSPRPRSRIPCRIWRWIRRSGFLLFCWFSWANVDFRMGTVRGTCRWTFRPCSFGTFSRWTGCRCRCAVWFRCRAGKHAVKQVLISKKNDDFWKFRFMPGSICRNFVTSKRLAFIFVWYFGSSDFLEYPACTLYLDDCRGLLEPWPRCACSIGALYTQTTLKLHVCENIRFWVVITRSIWFSL